MTTSITDADNPVETTDLTGTLSQPGRRLSIAEVQAALRLVRQPAGQHTRQSKTPATHAPEASTGAVAPADCVGSLQHASPGQRDDSDADDPYDWKERLELDVPAGDPEEPSLTQVSKSPRLPGPASRRQRTQRPVPSRHRALRRVVRKVLGLNRPKKAPDTGWLPHPVAEPEVGETTEEPARSGRTTPVLITAGDVRVSAAPRGFGAVFWRWTTRALLVLLVVTGANQLFVRPFRETTSPAVAAAPGIDPMVAAQVAARYAADYLTYDPSADDGSGADSAAPVGGVWTGPGTLTPDVIQPGTVTQNGDDRVLVAILARLRVSAVPAPTGAGAASPTNPSSGPAAGLSTPVALRWVSLVVPVERAGAGVRVAVSGAVFSAEPPAPIPARPGDANGDLASGTTDVVTGFFTGYAGSAVSYLVPPGVTMTGLSGAVTLMSLADWSVTAPTAGDDSLAPTGVIGSAAVTWQLTGTDLQVTQQYGVSLTSSQGRWYVTAVAPADTSLT